MTCQPENHTQAAKDDDMEQDEHQGYCNWRPCPYIADIATIRTKLDEMDRKLDSVSSDLRGADQRMRSVEMYVAKQNGISGQRQWDTKTTMFVLMFIVTLIGSLASFWKGGI